LDFLTNQICWADIIFAWNQYLKMKHKVWFITGCSRGLGRALTEAVLSNGDRVAATARNPGLLEDLAKQYPNAIYLLKLDVNDRAQIKITVEETIKKFGRIDVLVNNAGIGILGAAEAYSDEQVISQLETNLYAPIALSRAILPFMRKQRSGRILQISSVGGRVGNPGLTIYQAAKFGLSGFSEALAKEVKPLGIWVTSIEPGGLRTLMTSQMQCALDIAGYEETVGVRTKTFKNSSAMPMGSLKKTVALIVELAYHPEPPIHLVLGSDAIEKVKQADVLRTREMEKWISKSISTDADLK
jgi:NAD(P)-dependent dehydrogenase (short-subunit alcohol dehydrogenase family)